MDEFKRRDIFHRAADLLEKEGWVHGALERQDNGSPSYCMVGALNMAVFGESDPTSTKAQEMGYWNEDDMDFAFGDLNADVLIEWNDGVARDAGLVITRLREMAAGKHLDPKEWWDEINNHNGD